MTNKWYETCMRMFLNYILNSDKMFYSKGMAPGIGSRIWLCRIWITDIRVPATEHCIAIIQSINNSLLIHSNSADMSQSKIGKPCRLWSSARMEFLFPRYCKAYFVERSSFNVRFYPEVYLMVWVQSPTFGKAKIASDVDPVDAT